MTLQQALYVKFLRVRCEGSFSWIGGMYKNRYMAKIHFDPDVEIYGDAHLGRILCNKAMELLNNISWQE